MDLVLWAAYHEIDPVHAQKPLFDPPLPVDSTDATIMDLELLNCHLLRVAAPNGCDFLPL